MKLFTFLPARNRRRLDTDLGEKQLTLPAKLARGEHRLLEILAKNPIAGLPFQELDDGTILTESEHRRLYAVRAWEFGRVSGIRFDPEMENLHRWHESLLRRPSARSNPDPSAASGGRSWPSSDALLRSVSDG